MKKKLFCQISPLTYKISVFKCCTIRRIKNAFQFKKLAHHKSDYVLPVVIYKHNSLIRRKLGNTNMLLQENKATNLKLAAPKVNKILIRPGETFSFWHLVGHTSAKKGYKEGLTISNGSATQGVGGGLCQFTNLIHWMILHTPLKIVEHHHHDGLDLFPDFNRQIPFGTGTSIMYNYLDYRFYNDTNVTFQLITYVTDDYLCGELRANQRLNNKYHIKCEDEFFSKENGVVYRNNKIYKECIDVKTGNIVSRDIVKISHAKVMYDVQNLNIIDIDKAESVYS